MRYSDITREATPAERMVQQFDAMVRDDAKFFAHVDVDLDAQSPDTVVILNFFSKKPKHGIGTDVMRQICSLADRNRVTLEVQLSPLGIPHNKLVEWYERFKFSVDAASQGTWMVRRLLV